jgi:5-(carboxyamino)imidazole ribonucleotide synthase
VDEYQSHVHWYGKSPARLMRKLGHITALDTSAEAALERTAKSWHQIQRQAESKP